MLDGVPNEIVIVRRKNSWEDEELPHGVWKIAYADFMTALMAFFLVMWLINVTDDSVRRGVAQYFNPVKLASTAPNRKGLNDPQVNGDTNENGTKLFMGKLGGSEAPVDQDENFGQGVEAGHKLEEIEEKPEQGGVPAPGRFTQIHSESILFSDPYAVLDTLSEQIRVEDSFEDNPKGIGSGMERREGAQGGQAYRDPFDPLFWQFRPGRGVEGIAPQSVQETLGAEGGSGPGLGQFETAQITGTQPEDSGAENSTVQLDGKQQPSKKTQADQRLGGTATATSNSGETSSGEPLKDKHKLGPVIAHVTGRTAKTAPDTSDSALKTNASKNSLNSELPTGSETIMTRLTEVLQGAEGTVLEATASQIRVTRDGEGTLISLTDDQNFGMFAIGSAEPRPELVKLLKRIGKVVAETPGQIVIKGHTDARPFRNKSYDNWRLSSARAHMALYMLSRGGVAKDRFGRVEGYADRDLKSPGDPYAASNRRIEIYLLEGSE